MRLCALIRLGIRSAAAVALFGILATMTADARSLAEIRERDEQEQVTPQLPELSSPASCTSICRLDSSGPVKVGATAAC